MAAAFSACGGGGTGNVKAEDPAPAVEKQVPLDHRYSKIVFQGMTADSQVLADYPTALSECESSAIATVISKNIFNA
ncbi:MAG: hypothetical protein IH576_00810, partial [Deltaproteobacteria bacterium]|nr:hypothetical protein [Deltaproteobacteria bacterium]